MQVSEIKNIFHLELDGLYAKEEVDSFFFLFLEKYINIDRFGLVMQPNLVLTKEEENPFFTGLSELKKERPIQYIIGETTFMDSLLKVNENVLIPRPETEELVQWLIDDVGATSELKILDIGTGSGCIAVSLAKNLQNSKVYALDVSKEAIHLAKENAVLNGVEINFINADILTSSLDLDLSFDIIISNPPYVREIEKEEIHNNVKNYEPSLALFVSDANPLIFYEAIAEFSKKHLSKDGKLYIEINQYLGEETKALFENKNFNKVILKKDIFDNHRMIRCEK